MTLSDELKMAAQMGMRAGVETAIACLQASADDPRSSRVAPVSETLNVAIALLRKRAKKQWPEGSA